MRRIKKYFLAFCILILVCGIPSNAAAMMFRNDSLLTGESDFGGSDPEIVLKSSEITGGIYTHRHLNQLLHMQGLLLPLTTITLMHGMQSGPYYKNIMHMLRFLSPI